MQNAPYLTILAQKSKLFGDGGTDLSPDSSPIGKGDTPFQTLPPNCKLAFLYAITLFASRKLKYDLYLYIHL